MKQWVFFLMIGFLVLLSCETDKSVVTPETAGGDDYTIYYQVISKYFNDKIPAIILQDSTWGDDIGEHHIQALAEEGVTLKEETLLNYKTANAVRTALDPIEGIDITFRSEVDNNDIWSKPNVSLSVVGYDDSKTEAIVTVGVIYAPLAGSGMLYYLVRENNMWTIKASRMIWIS